MTVADLKCQQILVDGLTEAFPTSGICAEEGVAIHRGDTTWFVDPIDGTGAFIDGLAHWGPTVALVDEDGPLIGATHFPLTGEFWFARRGQGVWRNGTRVVARPIERLRHNHSIMVPSRFHQLPAIPWKGKVRALGSTAAHLALVAGSGPIACVVGEGWRMWDVGAGALFIQEAGRSIVDMSGEVYHPVHDRGRAFVAGDLRAITALLPLLHAAGHDG